MKHKLLMRLPSLGILLTSFLMFLTICMSGLKYDFISTGGCSGSGCYNGSYRTNTNWFGAAFYYFGDAFVSFIMYVLGIAVLVVLVVMLFKNIKAPTKQYSLLTTILSFVAWPLIQVGAIFNDCGYYYSTAKPMIVFGYLAMVSIILTFGASVARHIYITKHPEALEIEANEMSKMLNKQNKENEE